MNYKKVGFCFFSIAMLGVLFVLNGLSPKVADDYVYVNSFFDGTRIENPLQIIPSMMAHYQGKSALFNIQGGRLVVHTIAQLMLLFLPDRAFDVVNAVAGVGFSWILLQFSKDKKQFSLTVYVCLILIIFLFAPAFGQTMLWTVGSANYLWGAIVSIGWLAWIDKLIEKEQINRYEQAGVVVYAFFAGFCNENTSAAVLLIVGLLLLLRLYEKKKWKIWMILSCSSGFAGWLVMILAPGNNARLVAENADVPMTFSLLLWRFVDCTLQLQKNMAPLIVLCAMLFGCALAMKLDKHILLRAGIFIVGAFACAYSMVMAPYISYRSLFGVFALFAIAASILIAELQKSTAAFLSYALCGIGAVLCFFLVVPNVYHCYLNYGYWNARQASVMEQKEQGKEQIETYSIVSSNPYSVFFQLEDITDDPAYWTNEAYAEYYGITSVISKEVKYT